MFRKLRTEERSLQSLSPSGSRTSTLAAGSAGQWVRSGAEASPACTFLYIVSKAADAKHNAGSLFPTSSPGGSQAADVTAMSSQSLIGLETSLLRTLFFLNHLNASYLLITVCVQDTRVYCTNHADRKQLC